jgi:hypothetical protein
MTSVSTSRLTFSDVDDLAFAAKQGRLRRKPVDKIFAPECIGPLLELAHLSGSDHLPPLDSNPWISLVAYKAFYSAFMYGCDQWICPRSKKLGFIRTIWDPSGDTPEWDAFRYQMQRAAEAAGFPGSIPAKLVGAIGELESNLHEHSEAAHTGIVAFQAISGGFEFVVADRGIGVLKSLRSCEEHANLHDGGKALSLALTDGVSRFGKAAGRGLGFRQIFVGLANLNSTLRFRSDDHALTIDGYNPKLPMSRVGQRPSIDGFFTSVSVATGSPSWVAKQRRLAP